MQELSVLLEIFVAVFAVYGFYMLLKEWLKL